MSSGTIPASGSIEIVYTAPEACGLVELITTIAGTQLLPDYNQISVGTAFSQLSSSQSILLIGQKPQHPENHFGHPSLISLLVDLAGRFFDKFKIPLAINDISLRSGGLFDVQSSWNAPHKAHRNGLNADVRSIGLSPAQLSYLKSTAIFLGFRILVEDGPPHLHLTLEPEAWIVEKWEQTQQAAMTEFWTALEARRAQTDS